MLRVAVFVDAGYLYAMTSLAAFHTMHPRVRLSLDVEAVVRQLRLEAWSLDGGGGRLIRIYWYDGVPKAGMTPEQSRTAALQDVKLRLGSVNSFGEQKGVDALIAHDLSELGRNHAIDAALLVSGDEDILVGVQTAQSFGVRVHILGIDPARSQSQRLLNEADVAHEWPERMVVPWISARGVASAAGDADGAARNDDGLNGAIATPLAPEQMTAILAELTPSIRERAPAIVLNWDRVRRIPIDVNTRLMQAASDLLERSIEQRERIAIRRQFVDALRPPEESVAELAADDAPEIEPAAADTTVLAADDASQTDEASAPAAV
jgi:uncharacterized LabA/DUF88 family protein